MINVRSRAILVLFALLSLSGCKSDSDKLAQPPQIRPVLTAVVRQSRDHLIRFAGTIQPQYQTDLSFQVLGRINTRDVDVGDIIKRGQTLATLDPLVLDLALQTSKSELAKAKSQTVNAAAAEGRRATLLDKKVVSQADYDSAEQALAAAQASEKQAVANLDKAGQQRGYTKLSTDIDGVVTSVNAQAGQTVTAGQKVVTVARTDIREAVIDIPENGVSNLAIGSVFEVQLQANTTVRSAGKVREIAPLADPTTKTRRVKITLDEIQEGFRLGATITAYPVLPETSTGMEVPTSALLEKDGSTKVWLVDTKNKTVKPVAVKVVARKEGLMSIVDGLAKGTVVVIAGIHSLTEGQSVKVEEVPAP